MADKPARDFEAHPSARQTLPKTARVCSRAEFDRVFKGRNRASDAVLTVYMARTDLNQARLGISASRRLGNAVARNRIKRLVREAFRRHRLALPLGTDWIVVPRQAAASFQQVEDSFRQLSTRLLRRGENADGLPTPPAARGE